MIKLVHCTYNTIETSTHTHTHTASGTHFVSSKIIFATIRTSRCPPIQCSLRNCNNIHTTECFCTYILPTRHVQLTVFFLWSRERMNKKKNYAYGFLTVFCWDPLALVFLLRNSLLRLTNNIIRTLSSPRRRRHHTFEWQ